MSNSNWQYDDGRLIEGMFCCDYACAPEPVFLAAWNLLEGAFGEPPITRSTTITHMNQNVEVVTYAEVVAWRVLE